MQPERPIVNISAYKFVTLDNAADLRPRFLQRCQDLELKGTILLAPEGINMFLAGSRAGIDGYLDWMRQDARLADIIPKEPSRSVSLSGACSCA